METNKTAKTLQECRRQASINAGYDSYVTVKAQSSMTTERLILDEAAELYAQSQTEELRSIYQSTIDLGVKEVLKCKEEISQLKSVMIAAAEEIQSQWQAHCDSEGYGPSNLMHRLEKGIASYYGGYNTGQFTKLEEEIKQLKSQVEIAANMYGNMLNMKSEVHKEVEKLKAENDRAKELLKEAEFQLGDDNYIMKADIKIFLKGENVDPKKEEEEVLV